MQLGAPGGGDRENRELVDHDLPELRGTVLLQGIWWKSGRSNQVDNFVRADDKFSTTESEVAYLVSPTALIIRRGSTAVVDEPMVEYWAV